MNAQIKKLLAVGALLGVGYFAFYNLTRERKENIELMSLEQTRKISQQIKQQILIVAITFVDEMKSKLANIQKQSGQAEKNVIVDHFRVKMSQIYTLKENLILNKFNVSKLQYQESLNRYISDTVITKNNSDIVQAMQRSINGEYPDLTVDTRACNAFGILQLQKIYEEISKIVLVALTQKLREQKKNDPQFNSNDNGQFKRAVRQLNVFQKKEEILLKKGFKEEWGSPNQVFFKLMETEKRKDPNFRSRMKQLENIYDQTVQKIAQDPVQFNIDSISEVFAKVSNENQFMLKVLSKSAIGGRTQDQKIEVIKLSRSQYNEDERKIDDVPNEASESKS